MMKILEERFRKIAMIFKRGEYRILSGKKAELYENKIIGKQITKILKGHPAFRGKVRGRVRIILDPTLQTIKKGEILVTGMTRPAFLSLIMNSSAFITDAGGTLSHAAITAREIQKPCIVGTKIATKVLHDGDLVEVDADKGVVKIIKRLRGDFAPETEVRSKELSGFGAILLIKIINFKFLYRHCERSEAISSYSTSMRLLRPRWGARNDN